MLFPGIKEKVMQIKIFFLPHAVHRMKYIMLLISKETGRKTNFHTIKSEIFN